MGAAEHGGSPEGEAGMTLPLEPTISDPSPTLDDGAPTLPMGDTGAGHAGRPAAGARATTAAGDDPAGAGKACAAVEACPPEGEPAAKTEEADPVQGFDFSMPTDDCAIAGVNAAGDSLPTTVDASGNVVPMGGEAPGSEQAVVERLGDRRERARCPRSRTRDATGVGRGRREADRRAHGHAGGAGSPDRRPGRREAGRRRQPVRLDRGHVRDDEAQGGCHHLQPARHAGAAARRDAP